MEALDYDMARKTVKRYCCSNCWGELEISPSEFVAPLVFVLCKTCRDETRGYVSQYFVNRRRGESEFDIINVTRMLQTAGVMQRPPRLSMEQNIKELGF